MKKTLIALLAAFLLISCGTARKVTKDVSEHAVDSTATQVTKTETTETVVDTSRTQTGEIIITEIVFDKPDSSGGNPDGNAELDLPGIGKVKGKVKSVKQTQVKQTDEHKGESKQTTVSHEEKSNANVSRRDKEEHKDSTPGKDPYRWRYIAFIIAAIIAAAVLLYLKRQPILRVVRNFIMQIRRFLK